MLIPFGENILLKGEKPAVQILRTPGDAACF